MNKIMYTTIFIFLLGACTGSDEPAITADYEDSINAGATPNEAVPLETDGSIAMLTAEIRQLRSAIDNLAKSHKEAQILSLNIQTQRSRIDQISSKLNAVRGNIDSSIERIQDVETTSISLSDRLSITTDKNERTELENMVRDLRTEQNEQEIALQESRYQEEELLRELQIEETQLNSLFSKIGQGQ